MIVENWFGRHKMLWGVMRNRYRLRESFYYSCFRFCAAFTNWHIHNMPLRSEDGDFEDNYRRKLQADFAKAAKNRKQRANEARMNRMVCIRASVEESSSSESSSNVSIENINAITVNDE